MACLREHTPIPRIYIYSGGPAVNLLTSPGGFVGRLSENLQSAFDNPKEFVVSCKNIINIGRAAYIG